MEVKAKRVLVLGLARSGVAAARLLASHGATVTANDAKTEDELVAASAEPATNGATPAGRHAKSELDALREAGVLLSLGGHPESLFEHADLIVMSPGVPADLPALERARARGVEIISEPELAGRFLKGRMIGVTGSNGKTTTTTLVGELMRAAGADVIVGGNIGTPLSSLVDKSHDRTWTVAELSSFQLELIDTLRVHVAVVTNITPDHLDRHGTLENYVRAKHRIFRYQTSEDWAVLNACDPGVTGMVASLGVASRKVYFASKPPAETASVYLRDRQVFARPLDGAGDEVRVIGIDEIPLRGMHNVENVMTAVAATFCTLGGVGQIPALVRAIKTFKGVEHRIEFVADIQGVKFYNDSKATNVDSTIKSLEAFDGNLIVILGGKDKGSDYSVLAPLVESRVKHIILLGAASDKIAAQLEGVRPMIRASSMGEAVRRGVELAAAGDTILLAPACASFDMFDNYEHRGRVFKEEVRKLSAEC